MRRLRTVLGHVAPQTLAAAASTATRDDADEAAAVLSIKPRAIVSRKLPVVPHAADSALAALSHTPYLPQQKDNGFGAVVEMDRALLQRLLVEPELGDEFRRAWQGTGGGLMVLRGLVDLAPEELVAISNIFGEIEEEGLTAIGGRRKNGPTSVISGSSTVARLGNTRNDAGQLTGSFINAGPVLQPGGSPQYRPHDTHGGLSGLPIWHTDSVFRETPPVGSLFFCKQAPAGGGGATCFTDTRAAFEALPPAEQAELEELECVCSLAHHDAKIHTYTPTYPLLGQSSHGHSIHIKNAL